MGFSFWKLRFIEVRGLQTEMNAQRDGERNEKDCVAVRKYWRISRYSAWNAWYYSTVSATCLHAMDSSYTTSESCLMDKCTVSYAWYLISKHNFVIWCFLKQLNRQQRFIHSSDLPSLVRSRVPPAATLEAARIRQERSTKIFFMAVRLNQCMLNADAFVWYTRLLKGQDLNLVKAEKILSFVLLFCPVALKTRLLWR